MRQKRFHKESGRRIGRNKAANTTSNMDYQCTFISAAANTVGHGSTWIEYDDENGKHSIIAYAASNFVALVDDSTKTVKYTLRGNKVDDKITCLTSVTNKLGGFIITGFQSGSLNIWRSSPSNLNQWRNIVQDTTLTGSLNTITSLDYNNGILISGFDAVGGGKIWYFRYETNTMEIIQSLKFTPHQLPNASHLSVLSGDIPLLAIGSVDGKVHLYVGQAAEEKLAFVIVGSLLGHEEWITCLSSKDVDSKTKFLASGSQDTKIRIWKISEQGQNVSLETLPVVESKINVELAQELDDDNEDIEEEVEEGAKISAPASVEETDEVSSEARFSFVVGGKLFLVFLESLLVGHEDWITTVHWIPHKLQLFSTSMDRNMVIWAPDSSLGGVWTPVVRVGDVGGALGGCIGGNLLGFVGGCIAPDGEAILGIGYGGSFHYWRRHSIGKNELDSRWVPVSFITGHFDSVNDIAWEPTEGKYLVSVSSDQTCRLFAEANSVGSSNSEWREISRPEIHGYDLNCVSLAKNSFYIYTGGEEKVIRIFDAPNSVLRGLEQLCSLKLIYDPTQRVEQAYIPELGLSNKGKETMTVQEKKEQESRGVQAINWTQPPLESQLADNTLWLEIKKMFGHNNEVVTMKMSKDGRWIASSSKARYTQACHVIIWSTEKQELATKLDGHDSTVVCIDFSHDGQYLASSGKDRSLCIYGATSDDRNPFVLAICFKNAHKRIVWDCSWIANSHQLITAARDGVCKQWSVAAMPDSALNLTCIFAWQPFDGTPVTAVAVRDISSDEGYLAVISSEEGQLQVWNLSLATNSVTKLYDVPLPYCHGKSVKRLVWRPTFQIPSTFIEFSSCGEDNSVRIHRISIC